MIGIGVIGVGRTAQAFARSARENPHSRLVAVADLDETKREAFAAEWGVDPYSDYKRMLARTDLDVAVILLPHFLHAPVALDAIFAGKHVFLEKPMAMTTAECNTIIERAARKDLRVMVGHHYHFTGPSLAAREFIQSGRLGRLVMANDVWHKQFFDQPRPPWMVRHETGGGMWPMNVSHLVDRLLFITGDRIVSVRAWVGNPFYGQHQTATDAGVTFLQFASGFVATVQHTGHITGVSQFGTEYIGTGGFLRVQEKDLLLGRDNAWTPLATTARDAFADQWNAFAAALVEGRPVPTPGEWGRDVVAVLDATYESSKTGREVPLESILGR